MKNKLWLSLALAFVFLLPWSGTRAAQDLSGRILLQVQSKGEAWYVNPVDGLRYYLGSPTQAFAVMRQLGLGISDKDYNAIQQALPPRLLGRIIIRVDDKGKAYYIDPVNYQIYYLGLPADAFNVMRSRGLGITNLDLIKIAASPGSPATTVITPSIIPPVVIPPVVVTPPVPVVVTVTPPIVIPNLSADQQQVNFSWHYKNKVYNLSEVYSTALYNQYVNSPKVLTYPSNNPPPNPRDSFYAMLVSAKAGDNSIDKLIADLKGLAAVEGYQGDSLAEFIMAFIQYIPYDHSRAVGISKPNYPYETLYKNSGICSDKSFLATLMLRRLNFGSIIFDFPSSNHEAIGIQCPTDGSSFGSGYCYVETTNYFPFGVFPQAINSGIASSSDQLDKAFDPAALGSVEYYQKTSGTSYNGMGEVRSQVQTLVSLKMTINDAGQELTTLRANLAAAQAVIDNLDAQLSGYRASGNIQSYNSLVPAYNQAVNDYNAQLAVFRTKVSTYNAYVNQFNQGETDLFQK